MASREQAAVGHMRTASSQLGAVALWLSLPIGSYERLGVRRACALVRVKKRRDTVCRKGVGGTCWRGCVCVRATDVTLSPRQSVDGV